MEKKRGKHYSRNKGHNAEREYAEKFRQLGFEFCKTSRQASRLLDDSGVDLSGIPLTIQIKSGYWNNRPKADRLFKEIKENLKKNFPPTEKIHSYPKVIIHKLDGQCPEHQLVTMMWGEWVELLKAYMKELT